MFDSIIYSFFYQQVNVTAIFPANCLCRNIFGQLKSKCNSCIIDYFAALAPGVVNEFFQLLATLV